jgi:selenoprotein W-related protein
LTAKILTTFKQEIRSLTLIPAGGGCFELSLGDELIYSKLKTGRFPDEEAMIRELERRGLKRAS